jgi:hypothetical protein
MTETVDLTAQFLKAGTTRVAHGEAGSFRAGVGTALGAPPSAPTAATNGAGVLVGSYQYVYTETDGTGESTVSPSVTIVAASNTIRVTVPTPRRGVGQRNLYRKNPGAPSYRLVHAFGGGYFQNLWDDNVADATVAAAAIAPSVDTTSLFNLEIVGGVKFFRTHPNQGTNPADITVLTGEPTHAGAYAMDVYGTLLTRTYAGDGLSTIKTGDHGGYAIAAYDQGDIDDGAAAIGSWHVGPRGAMQVGSFQVPLLSTEYVADFRGNALTTFTGTSTVPAVISLRSPNVIDNFTAVDFIYGESSDVMGRIGVKHGSGGSSILFGVSNSYASGITHIPLTLDTTTATFAVSLVPSVTATNDLGSGSLKWRHLNMTGTATADNFLSSSSNKTDRAAAFSAPIGGNSVFFGHSNTEFLSTLGGLSGTGLPFLAFYAYHSSTASTLKRASATKLPSYFSVDTTGNLLYRTAPAGTVDADISDFSTVFTISNLGKTTVKASATAAAGFNLPHGAAPTSPADGDMWSTTAGLFIRVNGVTKTVTLT